MSIVTDNSIACAIKTIENVTGKPEEYLHVQCNKAVQIRKLIKNVYDFTKNNEDSTVKINALPELIIQDFDEEQIWQQLELQNEGRWARFITDVSKLVTKRENLKFPLDLEEHKSDNELDIKIDEDIDNGEHEKENSDYSSDDSMGSIIDARDLKKINSDEDDIENENITESNTSANKRNFGKSSIVDDQFFKLSELEQFLDSEDKKVMNNVSHLEDESSDNEGPDAFIDYFKDMDSEDQEDEDDDEDIALNEAASENEDDNDKNPKYSDFFDAPHGEKPSKREAKTLNSEDNDHSDNDSKGSEWDLNDAEIDGNEGRRVRFNLSENKVFDHTEAVDSINSPVISGSKSTFEIRQERLTKKIGHLENAALSEKPWQLKGEITAVGRPQNSLLEELVEFDLSSRSAPVITEETTLRLEDIIRQRVKDKTWDDVEKKAKPVDSPMEYKKKLVLDQEKSKQSLAQVYEHEYMKQKAALESNDSEQPEEVPALHIEIDTMMTSLFAKLDALSNFHYTPKIAVPDVKIISNLPAINMEEVAPVATSDAALLAPEEIKAKTKGEVLGKSERTTTDKKRERRHKKIVQREKEKEKEKRTKLVEKLRPGLGNKYSKERTTKMLEKVSKGRNVEKMDVSGDGRSIKSSTTFFKKLQDEVSSQIKSKVPVTKNKKKENVTAKQLKL